MTTPFLYQRHGARAIHRFQGRALLADEMGLGKTLQTLLYLHNHPEALPAVVVCPASLKFNWERECTTHFGFTSRVLEGTKPRPLRCGFARPAPITIINYDVLQPWLPYLSSLHPQTVILDECQALKNPRAKRTRAARVLCEGVNRVLALSGTPLTNRPAELWPVLNLLRPDLFPSFYPFGMRYCGPRKVPWGAGWEFRGASRLKELHRILTKECMIRRRKADVLKELPAKQRFVVPLPLSDEREYHAAETDFLAWLGRLGGPAKLQGAAKAEGLTKLGYLKRLAGKLKLEASLHWAGTFLEGTEEKLILFGIHHDVMDAAKERFGRACVVVTGETPQGKRRLAVDQFQTDPQCRVFLGNIEAAGKGLNLTAASTVAFLELDWVPGNHTQAEDRVHRIKQKKKCSAFYLAAKGTVEMKLLKVIQAKQQIVGKVLDGSVATDPLNVHDLVMEEMLR